MDNMKGIDEYNSHVDRNSEADNPEDAMIAAVSEVTANTVELTVEVNPELTALKEQYEALSGADRTYGGKVRSFEEVLNAVPNVDNLLAEMATLEDGSVYFLSEEGELVLGDGCAEPLETTLGSNYHKSRSEAMRVSYVDDRGVVTTIKGDDTEVPDGAKIISERGLITLDECEHVNRGKFEKTKCIWTEGGKNPSIAHVAHWAAIHMRWYDFSSNSEHPARGSRRVLRVKLNFKS